MIEEKLRHALSELEALKIEKAKGKQGWAVWHSMEEKRLGRISMSVELLSEISDEEWKNVFGKIRVIQAIPDVFKGTIEYTCMGPMFDVCREFYTIPKYTIRLTKKEDGEFIVIFVKE